MILLRFDRDLALKKGAHAVEVLNEAGESVGGEAEISGYSRRTMIVHLEEAVEEGEVSVLYSVRFAGSDETVEGAFDFAIEPGFEGEEIEEVALGEPRSEQSIVLWTIAIMLCDRRLRAAAVFPACGHRQRAEQPAAARRLPALAITTLTRSRRP